VSEIVRKAIKRGELRSQRGAREGVRAVLVCIAVKARIIEQHTNRT